MPAISAFPSCCGATIMTGFSGTDPKGLAGFKINPVTMTYELDTNGNKIQTTYEDLFYAELNKYKKVYPGYMYCCILTDRQITESKGAWLELLKKVGFEHVRRWTNSVHSDREFLHLFVLCTDEKNKCKGDFTQPPKGWEALPGPVRETPKPSVFQTLKSKTAVRKAA